MSIATAPRRAASRTRHPAGETEQAAVEVEHLQKRCGEKLVLSDVSFSVRRGEVFGILGPNGAGRTTTVEVLQGLRSRDGGAVRVVGLDPQTGAARLRRRIGSQLQASALPQRMKVWEALDLFGALTPGGGDQPAALERWGLSDQRNASFGVARRMRRYCWRRG